MKTKIKQRIIALCLTVVLLVTDSGLVGGVSFATPENSLGDTQGYAELADDESSSVIETANDEAENIIRDETDIHNAESLDDNQEKLDSEQEDESDKYEKDLSESEEETAEELLESNSEEHDSEQDIESGKGEVDSQKTGESKGVEGKYILEADESVKPLLLKRRAPQRAAETTNLNDVTQSIEMVGITQDENGIYHIEPNKDYVFKLKFEETESLQFANEETLIYNVPNEIKISQGGTFSMTVQDSQGTTEIDGNTFEVKEFPDGHREIHVKFNTGHPDFDRLKAVGNAKFTLELTGKIQKEVITTEPFTILGKDFQYTIPDPSISIDKKAAYDKKTSIATYKLIVKSVAENTDVVIKDELKGTALTFNKDVIIESNKNGTLSLTPTYTAKGFSVTVPKVVDGEILTLTYTAKVDPEGIVTGQEDTQLKNVASAHSHQVPDEVTVEKNVELKLSKIYKKLGAGPEKKSENIYHCRWDVYVNDDFAQTTGGKTISDNIEIITGQDFPDGSKRVYFIGDGIKIEVTFSDGRKEVRDIPWSQLTLEKDNKDHIIKWSYKAPESDGNARYKIKSNTETDITNAGVQIQIRNTATDGLNIAHEWATIVDSNPGTPGELPDILKIEKFVRHVSNKEIKWGIEINAASTGYTYAKLDDDYPVSSDKKHVEKFDLDSIVIEGLLPGESYKVSERGDKGIRIEFFKDAEKTIPGLQATPDGKARKITISISNPVNQQWLQAAHDTNYEHKKNHTNRVYLGTDKGNVRADANAIPKKQSIYKKALPQTSIKVGELTFPVFNYYLELTNPSDGDIINDVYDTKFLSFVTDDSFTIEAYDKDGNKIEGLTPGKMEVQPTGTGSSIILTELPKKDGKIQYKYRINYALIPKDADALNELNSAAFQLPSGGYKLNNVAGFNGMESENTIQEYHYSPVLDKKLVKDPSSENGYIAQYSIVLNENEQDLVPDADVYEVADKLSDNLRLKMNTIQITGDDGMIVRSFDAATNTISFRNIPDGKKIVIKYDAVVLGAPLNTAINIGNTITMLGYTKIVEKEVDKIAAGSGSASNPSITIMKRDKDTSEGLAGAEFKLVRKNGESWQDVTDKNGDEVKFTTRADGSVLIEGNQELLGWVLWADQEYGLIETQAPSGYLPLVSPITFLLKERPENHTQYTISGDTMDIYNEREKVDIEAEKTWQGGKNPRPTVWFKLYRKIENGNLEAVPSSEAQIKAIKNGESKVVWTGMYKSDKNDNPYTYVVKEVDSNGNETAPAGYTKEENGLKVVNTANKVVISKVALGQNEELKDADLRVVKSDGTEIAKWTSTGTAKVIEAIAAGEYELIEEKAPAGYNKASKIEFRVKLDGTVEVKEGTVWKPAADAKVQMVDELTERDVKVSKIALGQTAELKGAELKVTGKDVDGHNFTKSWTSTETAEVLKLKAGEYKLTEVKAPTGYNKASEIEFRVKLDGTVEVKEGTVWKPAADAKVQMVDELTERDVKVSKIALGQNKELVGAELKVTGKDVNGHNFTKSWTSTETAEVLKLKAGEYKLTEVKAPTGYSKAAEIEFRVKLDGTVKVKDKDGVFKPAANATVQMVDELKANGVTISKVALGQTAELKDAELKVVRKDGSLVSKWKSDGTEKVLDLVAGEYKLIEVKAPTGYNTASEIEFKVELDGSVKVKDKDGVFKPVADAKVQMIDELTERDVKVSKVALGQTAELKGAELKVTGKDVDGHSFTKSWTSTETAEVLKLKAGEYKLTEVKAPTGYNTASEIEFRVKLDGTVEVKEGTVWKPVSDAKVQMVDELTERDVKVSKIALGQTAELKGAELKVTGKDVDGHNFTKSWTSKETAEVLKLKAGEYKLTEVKAPTGYNTASEIEFKVELDGSVKVKDKDGVFKPVADAKVQMIDELTERDVKVSKIALGQNKELVGAELKVTGTDVNGKPFSVEWESAETAKVLKLKAGEYKLTEVKAPTGYNTASEIEFRVKLDGTVEVKEGTVWKPAADAKVQMVDELTERDVKISKIALGQNKELVGAELKVTGKDVNGHNFTKSWTSTETVEVLKLKAGEYKLTEVKAPTGYNTASEIEFKVELDGSVKVKDKDGVFKPVADAKIQMVDELTERDVKVSKIALGQTAELKGAELKVTGTDVNGKPFSVEWESAETAKVLKLKAGEYKLTEVKAPTGYNKASEIEFRVKLDGTVEVKEGTVWKPAADAKVQMVDELTERDVKISKIALGQNKELVGAELKVTGKDVNGHSFTKSWTSTETAEVLKLKAGEYKLTEVKAPTGYNTASEIEFRVKLDGTVEVKEGTVWKPAADAKVQMVDELTERDVKVSKIALGQNKELVGAELKVTGKDVDGHNFTKSWTSTETAEVLKLKAGEYKLTEVKAPTGYNTASEIEFRVKLDGTVEVKEGTVWKPAADAKVQMVDELTERDVKVSKIALGQTAELKGAELKVTGKDVNGHNFTKSWTSTETAEVLKLKAGEYKLTEVKAPTGYKKATDILFKVELDGTVVIKQTNGTWKSANDAKVQMVDEPIEIPNVPKPSSPKTGDAGEIEHLLSVVFVAIVMLILNRKKIRKSSY